MGSARGAWSSPLHRPSVAEARTPACPLDHGLHAAMNVALRAEPDSAARKN
jgi:hypothetical protein